MSLVINEAASFEYLELPADVDESLARSCHGYSPDSIMVLEMLSSVVHARTPFHNCTEDDEAQ